MNKAIDIWYGVLSEKDTINTLYWAFLNEFERHQALQFKRPLMQAQYVEVQGRKREVLGRYLDEKPSIIKIAKEAHGKPYLVNFPDWVFNLSHSAGHWVIAVAKECQLGIDLERYKKRINVSGLVHKCFAPEEIEYWEALAEADQLKEFYRFWTRKEAFVKATGRGIASGLNQCVFNPDNSHQLLRIPVEFGEASSWHCSEIELEDGLFCAVLNNNGRKIIRNFFDE